MFAVDLNCDLGESFGNYKCGLDEEVIPFISSANVACGFHASDPVVMAKTVALAKSRVSVLAHIRDIRIWSDSAEEIWQHHRQK